MAEQQSTESQPQPAPEAEAVVTLDADGNVVEAGDPRAARILRGPDAEAVLAAQKEPDKPPETKARKAPPEDK